MFSKKKNNTKEDPIVENNNEETLSTEQAENVENLENTEAAPELSAEEKLKEENAALNDKYLRLFAEFDNYKRRTQKERIELLQTAGKDVITSLLPVLDDFDRANKAMESATDIASINEGVNLIHTKLKNTLAQK